MSEVFSLGLEYFQWFIEILIWITVLVTFFTSKGSKRIQFIFVLAGYLLIRFYFGQFYEQNFFLGTTFMCMWFIFAGVKFFVSKNILILLFIAMLFLTYSNPLFYIIAFVLYTLTLSNFLLSTLKNLKQESSVPQMPAMPPLR